MKPSTRRWFLSLFGDKDGEMDTHAASKHFNVTERTIRNWWRLSCPSWVDNYVAVYKRSIPDSKEWQGFKFVNGELHTPYQNLTFTAGQLLKIHYDRQFDRLNRIERDNLKTKVNSLRNDEEAAAIRDEIEHMVKMLNKLKDSPIISANFTYQKTVKKR
ncbi:hypothetical protein FLM48_11020 [Shewanella sp. Scap07]|nr:hypothetical protein FLM48_11020 [Shewanella sp. Scap07]